jgi:hypothetical protein
MAEKIFQGGYMSGDTYAASAYMALDGSARIILVKDTKEPQDKTDSVTLKFYQECGLAERVDLIDISGTAIKVKELWETVKGKYKVKATAPAKVTFTGAPTTVPQVLSRMYYGIAPANTWPREITAVTGLVASKFEADSGASATKVADLWKIGKFGTDMKFALWEYAGKKFAKTGFKIRKNIVVIWSRQSGKKGGAHIELDSSYQGIREIASYFAPAKATVVLAGDERNRKLEQIASRSGQVVNVAEMWKDPFWKTKFAGVAVLAQLAFFKFLAEDYQVIHVGMRSGMLETMALLGMPVCYMEPAESPSGGRMLAFSRAGIPYSRVLINAPAGLTARAAQKSILSGTKAPSLNYFNRQVNTQAALVKENEDFRYNYGEWMPKYENYKFDDTARRAARDYGKAAVLGETDEIDLSERAVIRSVNELRGFSRADFGRITTAIESLFRT